MPKFTIIEEGHYYKLQQDGRTVAVISDCEAYIAKGIARKLSRSTNYYTTLLQIKRSRERKIDIDAVNEMLEVTPFQISRGRYVEPDHGGSVTLPTICAGTRDGESYHDFAIVDEGDEVCAAFCALAAAIERRELAQADCKQQRDELLAALKHLQHNARKSGADMGLALEIATVVIAKAEGGRP